MFFIFFFRYPYVCMYVLCTLYTLIFIFHSKYLQRSPLLCRSWVSGKYFVIQHRYWRCVFLTHLKYIFIYIVFHEYNDMVVSLYTFQDHHRYIAVLQWIEYIETISACCIKFLMISTFNIIWFSWYFLCIGYLGSR